MDEARLASQLSHPNIGQISELGEIDGTHFIAMEFVDGLSLEQLIEAGPIPPDVAARIMVDVLSALEHAHNAVNRDGQPLGIVHRDVTPSNILVSNDGIVKLVDFGVAKALGSASKTQSGAIKGKYAYMSPEQIQADEVSRQSDVFAAGCTLFEMLSGTKPFGDGIRAVSAILKDPPSPLPPTVPEPLRLIAQKALEKDLNQRYATARGMQLDLETVLRTQNSYVGQREIAILVRAARGLNHADLSAQEIDVGLFSSHRGEAAAATPLKYRKRLFGALAALGLLSVLTVASLFGINRGETIPVGATLVLGETRVTEADARPSMLFEKNGVPTFIRTMPDADVYHAGAKVGSTPLTTQLTPGNYKIEFRRDDVVKIATLEVPKDSTVLRWDRKLSDLDDLPPDAAPKPKPKKKKKREKPKDGFLDKIKRVIN
ncbi:MAG: serine/threonine-protein kinase [bacterium]